jgi:hypothetical protein
MEDMGEIFGTLATARLSRRRSRRAQAEEARISESPPNPTREKNLSEYVPSALISTEDRIRALVTGGAPAWSRRLKRIHDLTDLLTAELRADWHRIAQAARGNAARFTAEWQRHARSFSFTEVNELIARHNRYFPAEANLPMDVRTHDYVAFGGGDYRRYPLDAEWVLAQFPPDLHAALTSPPPPEPNPKRP